MQNEQDQLPQSRRSTMAWEIVCPDGGVRHFPYADKSDADFDVTLCAEEGCQIFPESHWLEATRPPCAGGPHRVVLAKPIRRDSNVSSELGRVASP
ncbi:MAG TPA: hypothetical protein VFU02_07125 [Polyangiaceae bacterium]|nr:hypothetical protein [Polyangiaceae bacterium]